MARLAAVLTPYCKWNQVRPFDEPEPNDGGFTVLQVRPLLHALLDRVHDVTGHPRPKGWPRKRPGSATPARCLTSPPPNRSEEHTSELQSLMPISYAVFCLKKKKT